MTTLDQAPKEVQDFYSSHNLNSSHYIGSDFSSDYGDIASHMKLWLRLQDFSEKEWLVVYKDYYYMGTSVVVAILKKINGAYYTYVEKRHARKFYLRIKEFPTSSLEAVWNNLI